MKSIVSEFRYEFWYSRVTLMYTVSKFLYFGLIQMCTYIQISKFWYLNLEFCRTDIPCFHCLKKKLHTLSYFRRTDILTLKLETAQSFPDENYWKNMGLSRTVENLILEVWLCEIWKNHEGCTVIMVHFLWHFIPKACTELWDFLKHMKSFCYSVKSRIKSTHLWVT